MFLVLAFAIQIFSLHHAANLDITQKMPVVAAKYVLRSVYFCSQFYIRCSLLSKAENEVCGGPWGTSGNCSPGTRCLRSCGEKVDFEIMTMCTTTF